MDEVIEVRSTMVASGMKIRSIIRSIFWNNGVDFSEQRGIFSSTFYIQGRLESVEHAFATIRHISNVTIEYKLLSKHVDKFAELSSAIEGIILEPTINSGALTTKIAVNASDRSLLMILEKLAKRNNIPFMRSNVKYAFSERED